jgi:hypothetical protein
MKYPKGEARGLKTGRSQKAEPGVPAAQSVCERGVPLFLHECHGLPGIGGEQPARCTCCACGGAPPTSTRGDCAWSFHSAAMVAHSNRVAIRRFLLRLTFCFPPLAFPQYALDWWTVDGGGGASTGGVYSVTGTMGQPDMPLPVHRRGGLGPSLNHKPRTGV